MGGFFIVLNILTGNKATSIIISSYARVDLCGISFSFFFFMCMFMGTLWVGRGMKHQNQIPFFSFSKDGLRVAKVLRLRSKDKSTRKSNYWGYVHKVSLRHPFFFRGKYVGWIRYWMRTITLSHFRSFGIRYGVCLPTYVVLLYIDF